jgi:hypothetical protein
MSRGHYLRWSQAVAKAIKTKINAGYRTGIVVVLSVAKNGQINHLTPG